MFKSVALSVSLLKTADGARIQRRKEGQDVKLIAGVPVLNYHLAFQADRWEGSEASFMHAMDSELREDQEDWFVMMKKGTSNSELERVCNVSPQCEAHGHAEGVPFLDLRATEAELASFLAEEKDGISFVEPNQPFEATPEMPATQSTEVPWGLRRVRSRELSNMPRSDPGKADGGKGVHAYILDTGIRTTHQDFEDRAIPTLETAFFGFSVRECKGDRGCALDKQGHGTHCAGTVGGKAFGVAKGVTLHAVKVLGDNGSGSTFGITNSMDWVGKNAIRPAVASMSLGGGYSAALNSALDSIVEAGITVVTASGNENTDACSKSPGSASLSINVGATDPTDSRSSFSNWGKCLTLWAPGRDVLSAVATGDTASRKYSGTSMACPHVSGAAALLLSADQSLTPADVKAQLVEAATPDVVEDAKSQSPNLLLFSAPSSDVQSTDGPGIEIVNGEDASECELKYQVQVKYRGEHSCGGTLIAPGWVLSAAGCLDYQVEEKITVVAGQFDTSKRSSNEQTSGVSEVYIHPHYNYRTAEYDMALIKLSSPFTLNKCVGLADLPTRDATPGSTCLISGWGSSKLMGPLSRILQKGNVKIFSQKECRDSGYDSSYITDDMICAQGEKNGRIIDGCAGDKGGPLVCDGVVHGVTSWGYRCADREHPGVWSRVHYFNDWIAGIMC